MSTLSKIWKIVLSYKWGLLLYTALFGGLAIAMTFLVGDTAIEFEPLTNVPVAIFDRDNTEMTNAFTAFLTAEHNVLELEDSYDTWLDAINFNELVLIIEIPAGFTADFTAGNQLVQIEYIANFTSTNSFLLRGQVENYFNILATYLVGGFGINEASILTAETLVNGADVQIITVDGNDFPAAYLYFRFLPLAIVMVVTVAMGGVFIAISKQDVVRRLEAAPISYRRRTAERILSCLLFSLIGWAAFMGVAFVLFGEQMLYTENLLRMINTLPLVFLGIALAFVVTQFTQKREMLMTIVFPLIFVLATPAGIMFDMNMMGEQVLAVARFTPLYWFSRVNEMLFTESLVDWNLFWQALAIQIVFAAAILAVGMVFSKEKRAKRA